MALHASLWQHACVYASTRLCQPLYVASVEQIIIYVKMLQDILAYIDHCRICRYIVHMRAHSDICWHTLAYAGPCQHMPSSCQHLLVNLMPYDATCKHTGAYASISSIYEPMLGYTNMFHQMPTYTRACWNLLDRVFQHMADMLAYVSIWQMLAYTRICQHMLASAGSAIMCWQMLITTCWHVLLQYDYKVQSTISTQHRI